MSEDLKFVVKELNKILETNYNIISFAALNSEDLLQVLSDVLSNIQQDSKKYNVRIETSEQCSVRILSALRILKYPAQGDPGLFRHGLVNGDPSVIQAILKWLLSNVEIAKQRAYLARFLVKIEIPMEHLADVDLAALYEQYERLVDTFKMVHKERDSGKKSGEAAAELKTDLEAMEKEREVILERVQKMKSRAEAAPQLLQFARKLRAEKDRERKLASQKQEQQESIAAMQVSLQRSQRELQNLKEAGANLTAQKLIKRLSEEVMVQKALSEERLPNELVARKLHIKALKTVTRSPHLGSHDIVMYRNRLDTTAREVQALAEKRALGDMDKIAPFRQQITAVATIKSNALDRLRRSKETLEELEARLAEKRAETKQLAADVAPRGEDLKRYVAHLRARSAVYKQRRAELADLRVEVGVLTRSLSILEKKLGEFKSVSSTDAAEPVKELPEGLTAKKALRVNVELSQNISTLRAQLVPLLSKLRPLREKYQDLTDRYERARKTYKSVEGNMDNSIATLPSEVKSAQQLIENETEQAKQLRDKISQLKIAQEKIQQEMRRYASPGIGRTLRDELNDAIQAEEKKLNVLKDEESNTKDQAVVSEMQIQLWNNVITIYECKYKCVEDNRRQRGIVVRGQGAETLILQ